MRRFLAFLALLVMTWPHVVGMRCDVVPMRSAGHEGTSVATYHGHAAHACAMPMACSSSMIEGPATERVAEPDPPPLIGDEWTVGAPTATVLTSDPPPPRRHA